MGDFLLMPIKWIGLFLEGGELFLRPFRPDEKIGHGVIVQYCRFHISGLVEEQLPKYEALLRQYGNRMDPRTLEYLDGEIRILKSLCKQ